MTAREILKSARTILVVDWPATDVPESLARAGFEVIVRGGPGPEDFSAYEMQGDAVVPRHVGRAPDRVEVLYSHRPLTELPGLLKFAVQLQAKAIWYQSGMASRGEKDPKGCWIEDGDSQESRALVEAAGLVFLYDSYIGDVARELQPA